MGTNISLSNAYNPSILGHMIKLDAMKFVWGSSSPRIIQQCSCICLLHNNLWRVLSGTHDLKKWNNRRTGLITIPISSIYYCRETLIFNLIFNFIPELWDSYAELGIRIPDLFNFHSGIQRIHSGCHRPNWNDSKETRRNMNRIGRKQEYHISFSNTQLINPLPTMLTLSLKSLKLSFSMVESLNMKETILEFLSFGSFNGGLWDLNILSFP